MSDYFGPRWQLFVDYAVEVLSTNSTFSNRYIQNKVFVEVEEPFTFYTKEVPSKPRGTYVINSVGKHYVLFLKVTPWRLPKGYTTDGGGY